jgi:hypothetical protein
MRKIIILISMVCLLSACSKSPMDKLQSDHIYEELNHQFWMDQFTQRVPLWHEAASYCMNHSEKPNCEPVNKIFMCGGECNKKIPLMGHSSESVHFDT